MSKWILVFLPRLLQLIPLALLVGPMRAILAAPHPSAFLLNALISHSTGVDAEKSAASHISDYRQQPRSDSRADKPDAFPGFDAAGEVRSPLAVSSLSLSSSSSSASPTPSSVPSTLGDRLSSAFAPLNGPQQQQQTQPLRRPSARTEFYAQLVAKIIGNIGVDNILGSVERKRDKLQRLRRLKQLKADVIASAVRRGEAALGVSRTSPVSAGANDSVKTEHTGDFEADDVDDVDEDGDNEIGDIHAGGAGVVQVPGDRNKTANSATEAAQSSSAAGPKFPTKNATASKQPAAANGGLASAVRHVPAVFAIPANYVTSLWMHHTRPNQLRNEFGRPTDRSAARTSGRTGYVDGKQKPDDTSLQRDAGNFHTNPGAPVAPDSRTPLGSSSQWLSRLRGIWNSATKNSYVNHTTNADAESHVERQSHLQQQQQQQQQQPGLVNNAEINSQHPSRMQIASYPVKATESTKAGAAGPSVVTRAKLAFVNAFIKYSHSMSRGSNTTVVGHDKINRTTAADVRAADSIRDDVSDGLGTSNDGNNTKDVAPAGAADGPAALTAAPAAPAADEFDVNLNINDSVVAVGLAVERIAQLYGYREANNQATLTPTMASVTASDVDGNQMAKANDGRHERLRRVGERFINGLNKSKHRRMAPRDVGGGGGGRRNAPEDSDVEVVGADIESTTGSTSSNDDGGGFIAAAESVGIFVLEILGTIAGLGWGALTYLQTLIYTR